MMGPEICDLFQLVVGLSFTDSGITQKLSNVSRKADEIAFVARMLAAQKHPVGIYFISEDLFTLASYYQSDLHETGFLPENWTPLPDDELDHPLLLDGGEQDGAIDE